MTRRVEHLAHTFAAYVAGGGAVLCVLTGYQRAALVLCLLTGIFAAMSAATADCAATREGDGR